MTTLAAFFFFKPYGVLGISLASDWGSSGIAHGVIFHKYMAASNAAAMILSALLSSNQWWRRKPSTLFGGGDDTQRGLVIGLAQILDGAVTSPSFQPPLFIFLYISSIYFYCFRIRRDSLRRCDGK